jgi:4-amino-4-deoxy-L-arabinose transferase-like glycosyltransferase
VRAALTRGRGGASGPPELRRVWIAVLAVAVVLSAVLLVELARPREFLTGTNNAGSAGPIAHVEPGQRLCLDGLEVPEGTGRLRLLVVAPTATTVTTEVTTGGHVERGQRPLTAVARDPLPLDVPVQGPRGATALCVSPSGPIDLAGRQGLESGQSAPLLDGRPIDARVAVSYLPPAGERRSLLAQMPDMFARAARFRPGIVGPWTYGLVLFVLAPALFAAALLLLVRAVADRPVRRTALAVGAIGFLAAASWSLIVPVFDAPDEVEHMAYAQAVAESGRAPDAGPSRRRPYSSEMQVAYEGARISGYYGQRLGRPPWTARDERRWALRQARERPRSDDGGGWITVADYTPLYYASLAPAYLAADGSIWSRLTAMRLMTALFGGLTAACVVLLVRELFPRPRWPAVAAGLFVAFQPMFAFISGAVNNDAAVSAAGALALLLVVRALRRGLTVRLAVAIGATLVVLPLLKGSGLFLLPALAIGLVGAALRTRRRGDAVRRPLAALGAALAVTAAATIAFSAALDHSANPTRPGWYASTGNAYPTLPGASVKPSGALHHPVRFAEYVWQVFLPPAPGMTDLRPAGGRFPAFHAYAERGWAAFGFVSIKFPTWVYAVIVLAMLGLVALAVVAWGANRAAVARRGWELAMLVLVVLGVFFGTELANFTPGDPVVPEFGRYLFPAAAAIAALAVAATFGAGRRRAPALAAGLVTALLVLFWASEFLAMSALYS